MSDTLTDGLSALQQAGAAEFRAHQQSYSSANLVQIRHRVLRRRAVYGTGIGVAGIAAAGAIVFAASAAGVGTRAEFNPATAITNATAQADDAAAGTTSASPIPSHSIGAEGNDYDQVVPGTDAETILKLGSQSIGVSVEELRAAVVAALPPQAGGNYEGWLGVDGYLDLSDATADELAQSLVQSTIAQLDSADVTPAEYQDTLIVASLVAASAPHAEDWPKIAAVFDNRLAQGIALQADASVVYADRGKLGDFDAAPFTVDDRYNTYEHVGLPPGPIGAVSAAAIDAAANPATGNWLFFVTVNPQTGETKFAETLEEHEQHVGELLDWMSAHPQPSHASSETTD